jgi:hypothetical protein
MGYEHEMAELENWGRWGRQQDGPKGYGEPAIWNAWLSFKSHIAGWGLTEAEKAIERMGGTVEQAGDEWTPPINDIAAQQTDRVMIRLRARQPVSYTILRRHFYKLKRQQDDDLYPALRQYCDYLLTTVLARR